MVLLVGAEEAEAIREYLTSAGETFYELGTVAKGSKKTIMKGGVFGE